MDESCHMTGRPVCSVVGFDFIQNVSNGLPNNGSSTQLRLKVKFDLWGNNSLN